MELEIPISLKQIHHLTTRIIGDPTVLINSIGHLGDPSIGMLSFAESPKILLKLLDIGCRAVFIRSSDLPPHPEKSYPNISFCITSNPSNAFSIVLGTFTKKIKADKVFSQIPQFTHQGASISTNAFIGENVTFGSNTLVYPMAYIGNNVNIGSDCLIFPNAIILDGCEIGNRVSIGPGAVIGAMPNWYYVFEGEHQDHIAIGSIIIEDNVTIGANSTIDRGMTGITHIGRGTRIGNLVHIGHETNIGSNCVIIAQAGISGNVSIGTDCRIDAQSGIGAYVKIPDNTIAGPRAGVTKSVQQSGLYLLGFPAVEKSLFARRERIWKQIPRLTGEDKSNLWNMSYVETDPNLILCKCLEKIEITDLKVKILTHIREQLNIYNDHEIDPMTPIAKLGGDSLDLLALINACEEDFGATSGAYEWNENTTILDCFKNIAKVRLTPIIEKIHLLDDMNLKSNFLNIIRNIPNAEESYKGARFRLRIDGGLDDYAMAVLAAQLEVNCDIKIDLREFLKVQDIASVYVLVLKFARQQRKKHRS
jgi:UDP-3-O-[3-hydroxymyristoyl] glucosamine N-acyltransferase